MRTAFTSEFLTRERLEYVIEGLARVGNDSAAIAAPRRFLLAQRDRRRETESRYQTLAAVIAEREAATMTISDDIHAFIAKSPG